jgi:hypothetical protein
MVKMSSPTVFWQLLEISNLKISKIKAKRPRRSTWGAKSQNQSSPGLPEPPPTSVD